MKQRADATGGPTRLDPSKLKPEPKRHLPWGTILGLLVVAGAAGGGWWAYQAGYFTAAKEGIATAIPDTANVGEQQERWMEQMEADLADPSPTVRPARPEVTPAPAASVPEPIATDPQQQEPIAPAVQASSPAPVTDQPDPVDLKAQARTQARLAAIDKDMGLLEDQKAEHGATAASYRDRIAEVERKRFQLNGRSLAFEAYAAEMRRAAVAKQDGATVSKIDQQVIEYRDKLKEWATKAAAADHAAEGVQKRIDTLTTERATLTP